MILTGCSAKKVVNKCKKTNQLRKEIIHKDNLIIREYNQNNPKNQKYEKKEKHKLSMTWYSPNYKEKANKYWYEEFLSNISEGEQRILTHICNKRGVCIKPKEELTYKLSDWYITERQIRTYIQKCLKHKFPHKQVLYHINKWNDIIGWDLETVLKYFIDKQYLKYEKMPEKKNWVFYFLKTKKRLSILYIRYFNELSTEYRERMGKIVGKDIRNLVGKALSKYPYPGEAEEAIILFKRYFKIYLSNYTKKLKKEAKKADSSRKLDHKINTKKVDSSRKLNQEINTQLEDKPPLYYRHSNLPLEESSIEGLSAKHKQNKKTLKQDRVKEHLPGGTPNQEEILYQNKETSNQGLPFLTTPIFYMAQEGLLDPNNMAVARFENESEQESKFAHVSSKTGFEGTIALAQEKVSLDGGHFGLVANRVVRPEQKAFDKEIHALEAKCSSIEHILPLLEEDDPRFEYFNNLLCKFRGSLENLYFEKHALDVVQKNGIKQQDCLDVYKIGRKGSGKTVERLGIAKKQGLEALGITKRGLTPIEQSEGLVAPYNASHGGSKDKGSILANCDGAGLEIEDLEKLVGAVHYRLPVETKEVEEVDFVPIKPQSFIDGLDFKDFYSHYLKFSSYESNNEQKAFCPFHTKESGSYENVPSLNVNYKNGKWYCFSCGKGNSFHGFVKKIYEDMPEKVKTLDDLNVFIGSDKWKEHIWEDSYAPDARLELKRKYKPEKWVKKNITHTEIYAYDSFEGDIKYEKTRYDFDDGSKSFNIGDGRWGYGIFYRERELVEALNLGKDIFVVEGERKVDLLRGHGFIATCLDTGANSTWNSRHSKLIKENCKGARFILLPDNDNAGKMYVENWERELKDISIESKIVQLPVGKKEDILDYFKQGHTLEDFNALFL